MRKITRYEHEKLLYKDEDVCGTDTRLKERLSDDLGRIHSKKENEKYFSLIYNGVKFNSYVGLIQTRDFSISILPKAGFESLNQEEENAEEKQNEHNSIFKIFIELLVFCGHLRKAPRLFNIKTTYKNYENSLAELFIISFLDEVEDILDYGLLRGYKTVTKNNSYLKGKLNISDHISQNITKGNMQFNVTYQTYQYDNNYNSILYMALEYICSSTQFKRHQYRAQSLLLKFPKLKKINIHTVSLSKYTSDRRLYKYHIALEIAYNLLVSSITSHSAGKESFTILYNMNVLFQEYIYKLARKTGKHAVINQKRLFWKSTKGEKIERNIKPDIVVFKDADREKVDYIIEVKWVNPDDKSISRTYLSQIYTYSKIYENCPVYLMYPKTLESKNINGEFQSDEKPKIKSGIRYCNLVTNGKLNKEICEIT